MSDISLQPKAPKDPVKKGQSFYIIKNHDVFGSPAPDGRGIQYLYQSDGRLLNSARLIGGIEDEEEIELLKTVEGFKKLVSQVGVSLEMDDYNTEVTFAFQMYGKTDTYVTGTTIYKTIKADGSETLINLDDVTWSDDDTVPGQFRFEFPEPNMYGKASVKFYLNDGYTAPVMEDEPPVDFDSPYYKDIIGKSIVSLGNNARLKKAINKARSGKDTTLAFIGGSITQGAGAVPINLNCYSHKILEGFRELTGTVNSDNVKYVKAGVGGTPSELGMLRYERDVLNDGKITPDVVVIEFAVNDLGDETEGRCYDSLVRKIYDGPGNPAVILLFAVFQDDFNLQERLIPVGKAYDLPMVSTKNAVTEQFYKKAPERVITKKQYFYDCFHPTNDGHKIMADGVIELLKQVDKASEDKEITTLKDIKAPIGDEFENVKLLDRIDNKFNAQIKEGGFSDKDDDIQKVERDLDIAATPEFPNNWMHVLGNNDPFVMDVECKSILIIYKDSESPSVGSANIYVDGNLVKTINPHDVGWTHANAYIIHEGKDVAKHHVEVKMVDGDEDKLFTILGFGVCK